MINNLKFIIDSADPKGGICEGRQSVKQNIAKNLETKYDEIKENDGWIKTKKNGKYGIIFN